MCELIWLYVVLIVLAHYNYLLVFTKYRMKDCWRRCVCLSGSCYGTSFLDPLIHTLSRWTSWRKSTAPIRHSGWSVDHRRAVHRWRYVHTWCSITWHWRYVHTCLLCCLCEFHAAV